MHLIYLVPGRLSKKHVVLQKDTLKPLHDYQLVILAGPVPSLLSLQPCDSQAKNQTRNLTTGGSRNADFHVCFGCLYGIDMDRFFLTNKTI